MSNMQDWYAPLKREEPRQEKKKKKGRLAWRIVGGSLLLVLLIVASSLAFSSSGEEVEKPFSMDGAMPDDWMEFFDEYYTSIEGRSAEINMPRAELEPDFRLRMSSQRETELSLQEIYERCSKSIVAIKAYQEDVDGYFWGTGIIISGDGLILTNSHIIEGCDSADVILEDDRSFEAKLVGADSTSDIAVLKIEEDGLPAAEFGDSTSITVGEHVAAIGNPLSETFRATMTDGIISAIDRGINYNGHSMTLLQTNTAINEGNSGGALFNMYGQVIGVTNMKMMSAYSSIEGIGFAIPSSTVSAVVDSLVEFGAVRGRSSIGVTVGAIPENAKEHYELPAGLYVSAVEEKSDAAAKGIRIGDIITEVNGKPALTTEDILRERNTLAIGDTINFTVWRDGETFQVDVELMDMSELY